jgi:hypothetical protein
MKCVREGQFLLKFSVIKIIFFNVRGYKMAAPEKNGPARHSISNVFIAVFRWLVVGFPPRRPALNPLSSKVGFVVDRVALGQVFSEYFGFTCQFSFHRLLHIHPLSSGAGTIGQKVADVPSGLGLSLHPKKGEKRKVKKKFLYSYN